MDSIRIANFLYPYVRFFNADPNLSSVDFYMGNSLLASNINFGSFSPYLKVAKGRQEFRITEKGNKNNVIATLTLNFNDGEVYTVAAATDGVKTIAYGIAEPTDRENLNYGHLRVCHLSPNAGKVDVTANGYTILGDIDYLEVSNYITIAPGRYDIKLNKSGTDETVLNVSSQTMRAGVYNTLYIIGLAGGEPSLRAVLTIDAASYTGYYL